MRVPSARDGAVGPSREPRVARGSCILTGDTEEVQQEDLVLTRRSGEVGWALVGFLVLGWLGALVAVHFLPEKCPIVLPVSRRGYQRWRRRRGLMVCALVVGIGSMWVLADAVKTGGSLEAVADWPATSWVIVGISMAVPAVAYRLLLWNDQPWLRQSRGLIVDLWVPNAEAADAIRARVQPLVERASRPPPTGAGVASEYGVADGAPGKRRTAMSGRLFGSKRSQAARSITGSCR